MVWRFAQNVDVMSDIEKIQLFETKKIRTAWDEEKAGMVLFNCGC